VDEQLLLPTLSEPTSARPGANSIVLLILWEIWRERNNRVFGRGHKTVWETFNTTNDEAQYY